MATALAFGHASARTRARATSFEPNVVPFIDILMVLLVIFMVTAPLPTVDIRVDLPQEGTPIVVHEQRPTIVALRAEGAGFALFVGDERVELAQLAPRTREHARANNPGLPLRDIYAEARVFVRADQAVAYGDVVSVMDALQTEGFAKVGVFAETAQEIAQP